MDNFYLSVWWLLFFAIGVVNLPLTMTLFKKFYDLGYGLAKILGLFLITYLCFLGGISHLVPLTTASTYLIFGLLIALNAVIFLRNRKEIVSIVVKKSKIIIFQEILFTLCLIGWSMIRSYAPDARGLEKFMDLGFINSILRSKFLPAPDMWLAGGTINYYWFGHLMTAVATRLSCLSSFITYNLMIATILGFLANGAFSLISSLVASLPKKVSGKAFAAGIISLILVSFAGNFHTPIYGYLKGLDKYWYPDATRFIGYNPEVNDKTIHEFPIYSFVVSDLHAHLLDIPLVILFLALLWKIVSEPEAKSLRERAKQLFFPGLILGGMFMTNTWDFGNYLAASSVAIFLAKIIPGKLTWQKLGSVIADTIIGLAVLLVLESLRPCLSFSTLNQSPRESCLFIHTRRFGN